MAGQKILMVEGTDDEHVLKSICGKRGIPRFDEVRTHEGVEDLLEAFYTQLRASTDEGDTVGMVIDADDDPDARWRAIRYRLIEVGYRNAPAQPDPEGTTLEPPSGSPLPRAGVWMMPDNRTQGKLETFLQFLVPQQDALLTHATDVVETLPTRRFSDNDKPKAVMHTWLAWQEEPGKPYGTAITARFLDHDVPHVDVLVEWLKRLAFQPQVAP